MINEVQRQHINMAQGGDGGELANVGERDMLGLWPRCRQYNYPDHPDSFFQEICDGMEWRWRF